MKLVNLLTTSWHFITFHELFHKFYQIFHDFSRHEHVYDTKIHEQVLESSSGAPAHFIIHTYSLN